MRRLGSLIWIGTFAFSVAACETKEDNSYAKAQACLDGASQTDAATCRTIVDGIDTASAYLVRCSADFIGQGFDAATMATAFQQLATGTGNQTTKMIGFLVFSDQSAADRAATDCTKSLVPSMALLAQYANLATLIANACPGSSSYCTFDPNSDRDTGFPPQGIQDALNDLIANPNPATETAIGTAVQTAYSVQCSTPANASSELCQQILAAMTGATSAQQIGANLIANLSH